jgi:hypothetical protein
LSTDTYSFRRLFIVLCVIWLALNFNVLFGGRVLPWDSIDQFYPTVYYNAHSLRLGQAPWWNPYIYSGYPQIGDPQGMLFSPLLMGWMLLRESPGAVWFDWGVLLHLLMGGAAMLGLLRRHGANAFGSLLGATVFLAGGVAASRLEHTPCVVAYAYVPVVLLALRHFLTRPGPGAGALLGLAAGAMVTQLVQVTYLFVIAIVVHACIGAVRHWPVYDAVQRRRWCLGIACALVIALVMGLPQLVFSWAAMSVSNRTELPLSLAAVGSLDARAFLFLLYPNAFDGLRNPAGAPFDTIGAFLYIGVVPLLALAGLPRAWRHRERRPELRFHGGLVVLAAIYMMGTNTPVYGWLYSWLPGLVHFRRPADAAFLINFSLAFLAGIGASHVRLGSRRELTILLAIAACWLALILASMRDRHAGPYVAVAVAVIALWQSRRAGNDWRATLWLMALLVADYRSFNLNGTFNESGNGAARFVGSPAAGYLTANLASGDKALPGRISTWNTRVTWDNTVVLLRISSTRGYNPLRYALYERWYQPRESSAVADAAAPYNELPDYRLDDLLGVKYIVAGRAAGKPPFTPAANHTLVHETKDVAIWRNEDAYPRLLNPTRATLLAVDEMPDIEQFARTDFATSLWLTPRDEDDLAAAKVVVEACGGLVQTGDVSVTPTRVDLSVTSSAAGWIAAGDLDYPGWEAELDGEPIPIHRANGMFRAVCVPAGEHRLSFAFRPWSLVSQALLNLRKPLRAPHGGATG